MAREHPPLGLEDLGHIDVEVDRHGPTLGVSAFNGIDIIKMRNPSQRRGRVPLPGGVVRARRSETSVAYQPAGHLMVAVVIGRRRGQDQIGPGPTQSFDNPPARVVIVEDGQITKLQAEIVGSEEHADARASPRRISAMVAQSCSALPQSPGVIVAIVTSLPASRSNAKVPAH